MKNRIIVILINGSIREMPVPSSRSMLEILQGVVGGPIEVVPHFDRISLEIEGEPVDVDCVVFCNEEGKIERLPVNEAATRHWLKAMLNAGIIEAKDGKVYPPDVLHGNIAICVGDEEFLASI